MPPSCNACYLPVTAEQLPAQIDTTFLVADVTEANTGDDVVGREEVT